MSASGLTPKGRAAEEAELLAQLGLPPSAAPEDVDNLHQAASEFLAAAPPNLRGWAHAQAAALDAAYLNLTDPGGPGGSALKSPSRPPAVDPGGPATPPARRGSRAKAAPAPLVEDEIVEDDDVDLDDLYASVTPSAHVDMRGDARRKARTAKPRPGAARAAQVQAPVAADNGWRRIALGGAAVILVAAVLFIGWNLGGGGKPGAGASPSAVAGASAPAVDMNKVGSLMAKLQANPKDVDTLLALGDEYYAGQDFTTAGTFYDKVLVIDPKNVKGLLAKGAVSFNASDFAAAESTWKQVETIDPSNQEVHYDLGFLYLNLASPDWTGVQTEWNKVIALDSTTQLAQLVQQHLDSLVAASMIPGASAAASPATSPAAAGSPAASGSPAPSGSAVASPASSPSPAASPSASPAP